MKSSSKMLFFSMMITSTLMVMNSVNWISMWIGLEINLMSFIPLISAKKNKFNSQSIMMYFLVQSMSSTLLLAVILTNYMFPFQYENMTKNMIMIVMLIKMGAPPFHMWFPEMMNKMKWNMCLVLMTWQKFAPMFIMSMVIETNKMLIMLICLSTMTGAVGGLNQTSTRKIMAYSSINHMGWMIACAATFKKSWIMYLMIYSLMMLTFVSMLYEYNILHINQMNFFMKTPMDKIVITMFMLSMGGLPPFIGFFPKWIAIQYMISSDEYIMMMIMVFSTLITLSYYLRMSNTINLITSHSQKWLIFIQTSKWTSTYMFSMNMMLPMFMFLMNFC